MKGQITNLLGTSNSISKLKQIIITVVMLVVYAQFATAQQVSDGINIYNVTDLENGKLQDCTVLTLTGTWTNAEIEDFRCAIKADGSSNTENTILTIVDMSGVTFSDAQSFAYLFKNCTTLKAITFPNNEVDVESNLSYVLENCTALTTITNLDKFTSITGLYSAFNGCTLLKSVTFPENNENTKEVNMSRMFYRCSALTEVKNLDKFINITDLNSAFLGCKALESITLSENNMNTNAVSMNSIFYDCTSLTTINNLDKFSNISDLNYAFYNCKKLESATFLENNENTDAVSMNSMFFGCEALTTITNLDKFINTQSFSQTFENCISLTSVTLPKGTTYSGDVTFSSIFKGCSKLETVNNFEYFTNVSNVSLAFSECAKIKKITLPIPTSIEAINFTSAFAYCTSLEAIDNLDKYTTISNITFAFQNCKNLTSIKLASMPTETPYNTFLEANPNMLKYLPTGATIPSSWDDYNNFVIGGECPNDLQLVNVSPYKCPSTFSMAAGKSVTLNYTPALTLTTDYETGWNTIAIPFDVAECSVNLGSGIALNTEEIFVKAYTCNSFNQIGFEPINSASEMKADMPYLFGAFDKSVVKFTSSKGITVPVTEPKSVTVNGLKFTSDYCNTPLTDTKSTLIMNEAGSAYMIAAGIAEGGSALAIIAPFGGFFLREAGKWIAEEMDIAVGDEVPTGVESVDANASTKIYGVAGKVVIETPEATIVAVSNVSGAVIGKYQVSEGTTEIELPQGMYIINNKKVIVK